MVSSNINKVIFINFCQRFHLYIHAYALLLLARGLTLVQISLIESIVIGAIFLMEVPTGVLADRVGRKWSIFASTLLLMTGEFIFIFARSFEWYIFIALLTGTGFAFASGAVEALVYDSLPEAGREEAMKRAMGRLGFYAQIAFVIAPIIGGLIIGEARAQDFIPAIALTAAALLIGLIVCLTLREPAIHTSEKKPGSAELFRAGVSLLRHHKRLRRLAMLVVFTAPFTGAIVTTLGPPYLVRNEVAPFAVGLALSVGSLLAALTQRYAYKFEQWLGQARAIAVLILLPGALYWFFAVVVGPFATLFAVILIYGLNDMKGTALLGVPECAHREQESRDRLVVDQHVHQLVSGLGPANLRRPGRTFAELHLCCHGRSDHSSRLLILRVHRLPAAAPPPNPLPESSDARH